MALSAGTIYEVRSTATSGNVNGGGFNPANPNGLTNLTTTTGTGNTASPVVSSASYNFAAGDVGAWLYIQGGTNWTPGWYQIASVASNKATLSAGVGQAIQVSNNRFQTNTVAGCATTGTPTGGTFMIDYCQQNAAQVSFTNLKSTSGSTTLTDNAAGNKFTKVMVGNLINITSGTNFTPGWYEIISVTNANNVVLDRSPHGANTATGGHGNVGGAISLGGSTTGIADVDFFFLSSGDTSAASRIFIKGGSSVTYTISASCQVGSSSANYPIIVEGYASVRGDRPIDSTRPTIDCGANTFLAALGGQVYSLIGTGTGSYVFGGQDTYSGQYGASSFFNCKVINTGTTVGQGAFQVEGGVLFACEAISYRGSAVQIINQAEEPPVIIEGCYIHDSNTGISTTDVYTDGLPGIRVSNSIISNCVTGCINIADASGSYPSYLSNCTLYGAENNLGYGLNLDTDALSPSNFVTNCIFYGLVTAIQTDSVANTAQIADYNCFYNNTTDVDDAAAWQNGPNIFAIDPQFANVTQITGSTATTTTGNHLVQTGATFLSSGVVAGRDCVQIVSGTGVTAGIYGIASVDGETQITTDIALIADATADKVWQITTGRDFSIGAALAGQAFPGVFPGALTTGYLDIGGVQRELADGSFTFGG